MELQEFQESGFKDAVEKEAEVQEIRLQDQLIQVNESSEQSPNAVTSPLLLHQYFSDSYSLILVNENNFTIP